MGSDELDMSWYHLSGRRRGTRSGTMLPKLNISYHKHHPCGSAEDVMAHIELMIGVPCSGYINFTSVYIAWLCGAIFLHLPSFASLGIDFKTDLSLLLTVFLFSLLVSTSAGIAPCCEILPADECSKLWKEMALSLTGGDLT